MRLAAGLRPDLLGSLQLPRPSSWIWGEGLGRVKEGIRTGERRGKGKEEEGGEGRGGKGGSLPPQYENHSEATGLERTFLLGPCCLVVLLSCCFAPSALTNCLNSPWTEILVYSGD